MYAHERACEYLGVCVHVCDLHPEPPSAALHPGVVGGTVDETASGPASREGYSLQPAGEKRTTRGLLRAPHTLPSVHTYSHCSGD